MAGLDGLIGVVSLSLPERESLIGKCTGRDGGSKVSHWPSCVVDKLILSRSRKLEVFKTSGPHLKGASHARYSSAYLVY